MEGLISPVEKALTPSQADAAVTTIRQANLLLGLFRTVNNPNDTPEIKQKRQTQSDEVKRFLAYMEQAGQIKRAELEDGDASDATGEVGQRITYARQSAANLIQLDKDIPKTTSGVAPSNLATPGSVPQNVSPPQTLGVGSAPLTADEQAWVNNCHAALNNIKPLSSTADLIELYYRAKTDWPQAKGQYEQLAVPPRFSKAGALFDQGYAKAMQALPLLDQGQKENSNQIASQGTDLIQEATSLTNQAFDEIKAAGG